MGRSRVAVIIPAYNEEKTLARVIKTASSCGDVIVVNDCSSDNTQLISNKMKVQIVNLRSNLGYDKALNAGFRYAFVKKYDLFVTYDADGQHTKKALKKMLHLLSKYDVVVANRINKQRLMEFIFGYFAKKVIGITDPLSGLKGYRRAVYEKIGYFDNLNSVGTQLLFSAYKHNFLIGQFFFKTRARQGASKFGLVFLGNFKILRAMIKMIFFYFFE